MLNVQQRSLAVKILLFGSTLVLSGCALLQRSNQSGYANYNSDDVTNNRRERARELHSETIREMGYDESRELTDEQNNAFESRMELKKLEKTLESRQEKDQYYRYKPAMRNDRERISFLRIDSYEGRQRWLQSQGLLSGSERRTPLIEKMIEENDIGVGMSKQAVKESWGEPELVEVAGNPVYGNERWQYSEYIASADGYEPELRIVYFESGRVVGWEKH